MWSCSTGYLEQTGSKHSESTTKSVNVDLPESRIGGTARSWKLPGSSEQLWDHQSPMCGKCTTCYQSSCPLCPEINVLVSVTKVPCGPRETVISRDWWLIVVRVVVWCPLRICVISNGHQPVTFLRSFVTFDKVIYVRYQSVFFTQCTLESIAWAGRSIDW
jgi:hypothetical protein